MTDSQTLASKILDGRALAAVIRSEVATEVAALVAAGGRRPGLAAVLVGDDPASRIYVANKGRACEEVGMESRTHTLAADTSREALLALVEELNADQAIDGILVQLPLLRHLGSREVLERIEPAKDVDGFHPINVGRLWTEEEGLVPATPSGIVELLRRQEVELVGRHAVVVGRSNIVGKPMAALLLRQHCTVTIAHSRTRDLAATCRQADVLVAAVGRAGLIGPDHVKPGAVVVDVGMNRLASEEEVGRAFPGDAAKLERFRQRGSLLVGDVDFDRVAPLAGAITPVPGGVGPLTIAMLLVNTLRASRRRQGVAATVTAAGSG
ncbi:MAG TPA: bifunctional methylenetetrahydrofolate dehydrogenase/methenyltetrahydrofolate cyclohydrolase FolD [Thermoanaerobaculia bacterium]|nr:bifunctional methylenetetrahydrofolate dehydrogenase/methenyltetrahydrofolate cyclohydrolase FolD [Thermoanaerobaculia bacterium]